MWPWLVLGIGIGAYAAKRGVVALKQANIKMPDLSAYASKVQLKSLAGFEAPMSRTEAYKILNISPAANRDKIKEVHRKLMLANHPDKGGSGYLASKVNEAKDHLTK
eukprot:Platyproteum_vivax@DN1233_c0_g1_i1.p1